MAQVPVLKAGVGIGSLPNKVLLSIFRRVCTGSPAMLPPSAQDPRISLSSVCPKWRRLICSRAISSVWRHIVFFPASLQDPKALLRVTREWLRWSGEQHLVLDFRPPTTIEGQPTLQRLLYGGGAFDIVRSIILPVIRRIRVLKCIICTQEQVLSFLEIDERSFQNLKTINVTFMNSPDGRGYTIFTNEQAASFTVFRSLRRLREVTISIHNGLHPLHFQLPWRKLTKLDLGTTAMPPGVLMIILQQSTSVLADGFFHVKFDPVDDKTRPLPVLVMDKLVTLRLILIDPSKDPRIFRSLQLIALRDVCIECIDTPHGWNIDLLTDLFHYSTRTLRFVVLRQFFPYGSPQGMDTRRLKAQRPVSSEEMEIFFSTIQHTHTLQLPLGVYLSTQTIEKMAAGDLLPFLHTFDVSSRHGSHIISMARRRNELFNSHQLIPGPSSPNYEYRQHHCGPFTVFLRLFLSTLKDLREEDWIDGEMRDFHRSPSCMKTQVVITSPTERIEYK